LSRISTSFRKVKRTTNGTGSTHRKSARQNKYFLNKIYKKIKKKKKNEKKKIKKKEKKMY